MIHTAVSFCHSDKLMIVCIVYIRISITRRHDMGYLSTVAEKACHVCGVMRSVA